MKRKFWTVLCGFALCLLILCGCSVESKPVTLGQELEIDENGIISAEIFSQIKEENKVFIFQGESNGMRYEWTVFGSDIDSPEDMNLKIEFGKRAEGEPVVFRLLTDKAFSFAPVLSIYVDGEWSESDCAVYRRENEKVDKYCDAKIVSDRQQSIINLSLKDTGSYFLPVSAGEETAEETSVPVGSEKAQNNSEQDAYVTIPSQSDGRILSDGKQTEKDKYETDPVPAGKPMPVEPENQSVNTQKVFTCTFSIECSSILNHINDLNPDKLEVLPSTGVILATREVQFYEGESVYDVLQRLCRENNIQMESSWTPLYNSAYIEGIHNLYEFDCGSGSGWMYRVNGWYPNYGCSRYRLQQSDVVEWRYTCELGDDIGGGYAIGE